MLVIATPAWAQTPGFTPKPEHLKRLTELISQSEGPYKKIAEGIWQTSYKGKNLNLIDVRIATSGDGVFFMVSLYPRDKLTLGQDLLLKVAEFNSEYDYVKLALDAASLTLRLDTSANLLDLATFKSLENQTALAADSAYGLIKGLSIP